MNFNRVQKNVTRHYVKEVKQPRNDKIEEEDKRKNNKEQ